ncbi:MAG: M1 family metallopeptidase [Saprospiraceae bacterium]|nr:M1 family metallopeptidase [Saprospiraceae bacterium]
MYQRFFILLICFLLSSPILSGQRDFYDSFTFTRADSLRGMLSPERSCFDVTYYALDIRVEPDKRFISGFVDVAYTVVEDFTRLQLDLFANMDIEKIEYKGKKLHYSREFQAVFVDLPAQKKGQHGKIRVYYHGQPQRAVNAPWDGGFVWKTDLNANDWIAVACEGDGASLWWPTKDHLSDEPDSVSITVSVPDPLVCVSNGQLLSAKSDPKHLGYTRYHWFVSYPINNYNITLNIGDYVHFADVYESADGDQLDLDFYVLSYNLERAKTHFRQVNQTLACFENYFGKYPFWNDGFGMVETPYLGMEHQGAIAYGNNYMRGYLGAMIPSDMNWDYIIVHETGHEYFGNSISIGDLSEMWIHESFTTYMEALFVECSYSYQDAIRYLEGQKPFIINAQPILGPMGVNWEKWSSSDHYFKGSWVLHTLRHAINDDVLWFDLLRGFYDKHVRSIVTTEDFISYVNEATGKDFRPFFEQYLWYSNPPTLVYRLTEIEHDLVVEYKWLADVSDFNMPVRIGIPSRTQMVTPNTKAFQKLLLPNCRIEDFYIATDRFYIRTKKE